MFEEDPVPRKVKENTTEKGFIKWCEKTGLRQRKLQQLGGRGYPDRTVFLGNGRTCCIELKAPHKKARTRQNRVHDELREDGIPVLSTDNLQEAIAWITDLLIQATFCPNCGLPTSIKKPL